MRVLDDISAGVSTHLSGPANISKMIQRQRLQDLPAAPLTTAELLGAIPCQFRVSKTGERFLLYDFHDDPAYNL